MTRDNGAGRALSTADLDSGAPGGAEVARRLLALLASQSLRDGDRVPSERALSTALQAPRSVVREALRSLSLIGLLESQPGRGTYIHAADSEWVSKAIEWGLLLGVPNTMDLVEARSHLEILSAKLAAERREELDLVRMRGLVEEMQRVELDRERLTQLDIAFHMALARASKSEVLSRLIDSVAALIEVWTSRVLEHVPPDSLNRSMYSEHSDIVKAVAQQDAEQARTLMADAMGHGERVLREALQAGKRRAVLAGNSEFLVTRPRQRRAQGADLTSPGPAAPGGLDRR